METQAGILKPDLISLLREETFVFLTTIDAETKKPQLSVVSWIWATDDGKQIKIVTGHKGSSITNIQADPHVVIGTIGPETCYAITGTASVSDIIQRSMKYRLITVDVTNVEDVMFYGGKLTALPAFVKTYKADLVEKLDAEVQEILISGE
jgi:Pyridoxamine 5''-phosphate oxidase.